MSGRGRNGLKREDYVQIRGLWPSMEGRPSGRFRRPSTPLGPGETTEHRSHGGTIVRCLTIGFFDLPSQALLDIRSPELLSKKLVLHFTNLFMPGIGC